MPIYEFECLDCSATFESLLKSNAGVKDVTCSSCGSSNIKKTISASSHRLSSGSTPTAIPSAGCGAKGGFK